MPDAAPIEKSLVLVHGSTCTGTRLERSPRGATLLRPTAGSRLERPERWQTKTLRETQGRQPVSLSQERDTRSDSCRLVTGTNPEEPTVSRGLFDFRLPRPFAFCAAVSFAATGDSLKPALKGTILVQRHSHIKLLTTIADSVRLSSANSRRFCVAGRKCKVHPPVDNNANRRARRGRRERQFSWRRAAAQSAAIGCPGCPPRPSRSRRASPRQSPEGTGPGGL